MSSQSNKKLRLGGPFFGRARDPQSLVDYHLRNGFSAAYHPRVQDPVLLEEVVQAYAEANIIIAETGAFGINILEPDDAKREQNIQTICRRLERAESIGARMCVGHGGRIPSRRWGASFHNPENFSQASFEKTVLAVQRILDTVKPTKTKYALETESRYLPDSPDIYLELIKAVDRPGFGVHLDPTNIILSPRLFYFNGDFIRDCFAKLGPHIVSCHAKDTQMIRHAQVRFDETFAGNGNLDYDAYLSELVKLEGDVPLMIEHVNERQMRWARDFIYEKAKELGIAIRHSEMRE